MKLIDGEKLYNKLLEQEEIAMKNFLAVLKKKEEKAKAIHYNAQLSEIELLKYMIDNEPTVKAILLNEIKEIRKEIKNLSSYHISSFDGAFVDRADVLEVLDKLIENEDK